MILKNQFAGFFLSFLILFVFISSCKTSKIPTGYQELSILNPRAGYDDSTLNRNVPPLLMPNNRIIDGAGTVVRYGDLNLENHSLDLKKIPSSSQLAIEDRYGIGILDVSKRQIIARWKYRDFPNVKNLTSTYSGIQVITKGNRTLIFWSAADPNSKSSAVLEASWDGRQIQLIDTFQFKPEGEAPLALPNELVIQTEAGKEALYVVLNGNNQLLKIDVDTKRTIWKSATGVAPYGLCLAGGKAFVSNWGGRSPDSLDVTETAGVPYGRVFIDPKTGATSEGSVSVYDLQTGVKLKEIAVGLHPNDLITDPAARFVYVANGNSDFISVISVKDLTSVDTISVRLIPGPLGFLGDTPNALTIDSAGRKLFVANGLDDAIAVIHLGATDSKNVKEKSFVEGYIPTESYPAGVELDKNNLYVCNLEGEGARINSADPSGEKVKNGKEAYNSHLQKATVSIIPLPSDSLLGIYTQKVKRQNLSFRTGIARLLPRKNMPPVPVPERIGEPSVFKHVIYIVKENRSYDQIFGDISTGAGDSALCIYGEKTTPNQHKLAKNFVLLDNYYASGKCSAEGHQWTDAAMVTDYVEKNVRSWFRSYPHVQEDALVYHKNGFLWDNARNYGKTVRIYGEACTPHFDPKLTWEQTYNNYLQHKPFEFYNSTSISGLSPILSPFYPGFADAKISDQIRAAAFIKELEGFEKMEGDSLPDLSILAVPTDHTLGTRPGYPKPESMVADNDLAVGKIVEAIAKSKFWKNTVIFITEDDSQAGWDHVSAYRTTGQVISPYSRLQKTVSTNYNQTCIVRTIEQILGLPPMNVMDATALPMFDCFSDKASDYQFAHEDNRVPLNNINPSLSSLSGMERNYAQKSLRHEFDFVDEGSDDLMNRILWFAAKKKESYPSRYAGKDE